VRNAPGSPTSDFGKEVSGLRLVTNQLVNASYSAFSVGFTTYQFASSPASDVR